MVIKEYYMKNANESNTLSLVDIDSLFSEAKNETLTFADKNNLLFTKSMQVIILQDANIKEYVTVFKMSNNYNNIANKTNNNNILSESSITSSRIHKKKTFANSSISNDFAFYEEEINTQGCAGLMQISPIHNVANVLDIETNITWGANYLLYLIDSYEDLYAALGAYNMGISGYNNYAATTGNKLTPYAEKVLYYSSALQNNL